ncbi:MAG: TadE/TadG family type IV pilus assembly protein [Idiomarina sp.]
MSSTRQAGQATVETAVLLSLMLTLSLLALQLLWIFWQQHTLQVATSYAVRSGAIANGSHSAMSKTLVSLLSSTQMPELAADEQPDLALAMQAYATEWINFQRLGELRIIRPSKATQKAFAKRRVGYLNRHGGRFQSRFRPAKGLQEWREISVDHARARYTAATDKPAWLAARQLEIEVVICMPLRLPVAATLLAAANNWWRKPAANHFCRARQMLSSDPLWPLSHRLSGPMLSGFYTLGS